MCLFFVAGLVNIVTFLLFLILTPFFQPAVVVCRPKKFPVEVSSV